MAKIYLKGGTEKTLILAVREAYYQPFSATNWTDLRIGFFLSIVDSADPAGDDDPTGLAEEIGVPPLPFLPWTDRFSLGLVDSHTGRVFLGYTNNIGSRPLTNGTSQLISSDNGIGTTNAFYWRVKNEVGGNRDNLKIMDNDMIRARDVAGSNLHLPQVPASAGGYCTLVALRFQRDDARGRARVIKMSAKIGTNNGDILYTDTPTDTLLETHLQAFPSTVQTLGPVDLSQTPDTLWAYWPFHGSRLRLHCYGILRAA